MQTKPWSYCDCPLLPIATELVLFPNIVKASRRTHFSVDYKLPNFGRGCERGSEDGLLLNIFLSPWKVFLFHYLPRYFPHIMAYMDFAFRRGVGWTKKNQPWSSLVKGEEGCLGPSDQCDQKKSPNVYKSCPKMIWLEIWYILTPSQKLPKTVGDLAKWIVANGFKKLPKVQ